MLIIAVRLSLVFGKNERRGTRLRADEFQLLVLSELYISIYRVVKLRVAL